LARLNVVRLPALAAALLALGACSSAPASGGGDNMPGTGTVTTDSLTVDCNLHTVGPDGKPFAGDNLCILPPDPSRGFQFHFGPKN